MEFVFYYLCFFISLAVDSKQEPYYSGGRVQVRLSYFITDKNFVETTMFLLLNPLHLAAHWFIPLRLHCMIL